MSLHLCQFSVCVEHVSHVITYVPVLCIESIKTMSIEDVSTRVLEKIKNI